MQKLPSGVGVRYLYHPGELKGSRRRATDPVWSLEVYRLGRSVTKPGEPVVYYLEDGLSGASCVRSSSLCPQTPNNRRMGFSSAERSGSPFLVALDAGQPDVIADVAFGIVHVINA